jgi:membrane protease YdiL (CAAX protease family)
MAAAVGTSLFGCVFVSVLLSGGIEIEPLPGTSGALRGLVTLTLGTTFLQVIWEEYTFRGWPFSASVRAFGPHPVALALGLLFGLAHLLGGGATVLAVLSTTLAGWLLSYAMLAFGDISVPIGLHFGWNLTQAALTGGELWTVKASENALLSGGPYGLEASLPGLAVTAAGVGVALILFRRRWTG